MAFTRMLPSLTPETRRFWTSGEDGVLTVKRCPRCGALQHPSAVVCPAGDHADLEWAPVSGQAHLLSFTINHQMWHPGFLPPYAIGIVGLDEDPSVRLTTEIVDTDLETLRIGLPVQVRFLQEADVWIPVFTPTSTTPDPVELEAPVITTRTPASPARFEHRVAFTGIGQSVVGRRLGRSPISLTVEAALAAVADAGLELSDIDGLSTYPGSGISGGMTEGGITALEEALRIHPVWHNGGMDVPGQCGSVIAGMLAVAAGLCRHVLCFRTVWEATATDLQRTGQLEVAMGGSGRIGGDMQWRLAYGAMSAANWIGMNANAYFHRFGGDRDVLGRIAVNARANAMLNPDAIYRDPMSIEDYHAARMISTPFGLYDCDVPVDGAVAIIVSAVDTAKDLRHPPVLVEAVGSQIGQRVSWDQSELTHMPSAFGPAAHLWTRTDLTPADVDVAELYDGFTFNALTWLEGLGFCEVGGAQDWIGDGSRIALTGDLPMNTHGGQLSAGRLHGYGFLQEAIVQLRGDGGPRQVAGAKVAAASAGGGVPAGCFLLRAD